MTDKIDNKTNKMPSNQLPNKIEIFGVPCNRLEDKNAWMGQLDEPPYLNVYMYQDYDHLSIRIDWFNRGRFYLVATGSDLKEVSDKLIEKFKDMSQSIKMIQGRII